MANEQDTLNHATIVYGPTGLELDHGYWGKPVTFILFHMFVGEDGQGLKRHNTELEVIIRGLDWEDGSGKSHLFRGFIPSGHRRQVHGYYNIQARNGWVEIEAVT